MNEAADKKLTEVRSEAKEYRTIKDKEVAQFETEVLFDFDQKLFIFQKFSLLPKLN